MNSMIRVFARAKSKEGCAGQLRPILQKLVRASQIEAGVLTYELFEARDSEEFVFREEYRDRECFESHRKSRHVQVAVARAQPFMAEPLSLWIVDPVPIES